MNSQLSKRSQMPLVLLGLVVLLAASATVRPQAPLHGAFDALRLAPAGALTVGHAAWPYDGVTPQAAFDKLQARASGPLDVQWDKRSGIPSFVAGHDATTFLPYTPTAAERGNPVAIARGFLDENRALFRLAGVDAELELLRLDKDTQLGYTHVRMAQVYHGIPVFGRQLVVHLDPRERITAVNGQFRPAIDTATKPSIGARRAEDAALADLRGVQLDTGERATVETTILRDKTRLVVYVDRAGRATLTWQVTIMTSEPLGQWQYFIHAGRALVVFRSNTVAEAKNRLTFTADNTTDIPGRLLIQEGERSRDEIAQAAHDAAGVVYDYYFNSFKRDAIDGQGGEMVSTVHFGSSRQDAENAAWVGEAQQMIYGDGGRIFQPLAFGLDVVGHEFTHGIIDGTAGLVYAAQPGALNESYADVFGVMIDRANWTVGETIVKRGVFPIPYIRSLEDPSAGGNYDPNNPLQGIGQPTTVDEYANLPISRRFDNGGVHINSGIPNHAAYLLAQAITREKTEQIYYRTMTQYLTPESEFLDAANLTARAATELYGQAEADAVRSAWGQVGINIGGADTAPTPPPTSPTPPQGQPSPEQPPQLPAGCTDLIVSGGFENDNGWVEVSRGDSALIDTELPHSGRRSAWLGGTDQEGIQYIYQDVRVPANATQVQLSYFRYVHEETTGILGSLSDDALFTTALANPQNDTTVSLEEIRSSQANEDWDQVQFDLSQLAGKTIRLAFVAENPLGNVSSMFVDDVVMAACTTGSAPQAPPAQAQNQVYIQGKIADADTGRGVSGAQVFVLKAGLTTDAAAADDTVSPDEVLTSGVSDQSGFYRTQASVPRGQAYSVIVIARGYRPILSDGEVDITNDAENPYPVDATLRRSR